MLKKIGPLSGSTVYGITLKPIYSDGRAGVTSLTASFQTPTQKQIATNSFLNIQLGGGSIFAGDITASNKPKVTFDQYGILGLDGTGSQTFFLSSSTGNAYFRGTIQASAGLIGGWSIQADSLSATNTVVSPAGINYGPNKFIVDSLGNASVVGSIIATSGSFNAALYASAGTIGGFSISASSLSAQNIVLSTSSGINIGSGSFTVDLYGNLIAQNASVTGTIYANSGSFNIGGGKFVVDKNGTASVDGNIIARSGSFNGSIWASAGLIGNWDITASGINNGPVGLFASATDNLNEIAIFAGSTVDKRSSAPFRVDYLGNMYAQNANISGSINATTGSFRGGVYGASLIGSIVSGASISGGQININNNFIVDSSGNASTTGYIVANSGSFKSSIYTSAGTIGGFNIGPNSISANNFLLDTGAGITLGSTSAFKVNTNGAASLINLYASGTIIATSGSFTGGVYGASIIGSNITGNTITGASISGGQLNINGNASITGYINATSGSFSGAVSGASVIGGYVSGASISGGYISGNTISGASISGGLLNINGNASITGFINATSGSFNAGIYASVGTIGGWTIGSTDISSNTVYINSQYGYIEAGTSPNSVVMSKTSGFFAGGNRDVNGAPTATTPFWTDLAGNLRATNASITGNIVANSGSFAGTVAIATGGKLIAGNPSNQHIEMDSLGLRGYGDGVKTPANLPVFVLPTDGTAPTIGSFQIVKTGLITQGEVYQANVSGTSGNTYVTISPANAASALFIGMGASLTSVPTTAVVTGVNSTTGRVDLSQTVNSNFSSQPGYFYPNANLVVGASITNNITVRGQTGGGVVPALYTTINANATTDTSGAGFYIDANGKFRLAGTTGYVSSDANGNFYVSGSINAKAGYIGDTTGWQINSGNIKSVGTATYPVTIDGAGTKIYFGTGTYNNSNTPFYVDGTGKFS